MVKINFLFLVDPDSIGKNLDRIRLDGERIDQNNSDTDTPMIYSEIYSGFVFESYFPFLVP